MKSGKVLTMKAVALGVAVMFIVASCGSSDSASGGKTKNSALCFATQEDKDAAIATAQADLDAATATDTTGAAGGYRRPAVRSMSGDTTVPLDTIAPTSDTTLDTTVPSDSTVVDSGPNIPMLEQALADAQNQEVCGDMDASLNTDPDMPSGCTATFTSTGVSWDCPNGELFNAAIEDMSNPGVYPLVECASSGSFTVAEGQQFWFNFYLVNGTQTFIDGWNTDRELNVPVGFSVPEDTEGVCTSAVESFAWNTLPLSGTLDPQANRYSFTVPENFDNSVYLQLASEGLLEAWGDPGFDYDCGESGCTLSSIADLAPGEYFFETWTDSDAPVTWLSNIEIKAVSTALPVLPFSYTSDGSSTTYQLKLSEAQTVTLTATAGQTCLRSEDNNQGNGFADPELSLIGSYGVNEFDDNSGRGVGNCSASLIEKQLEPGTYWVSVLDDDSEGASITLGSSVELTLVGDITWNLTSTSASPDTTFEIVVPAGGSWFRANTVIDQTYVWNFDEATGEYTGGSGCQIGGRCADSYLAVLNANGDQVTSDDDGGMQCSSSTSNGIRTETCTNYYASDLSTFLEEGTYTLAVMDCCGPWEAEEPSTDIYQVNFGFGSYGTKAPKVVVVVNDNPTIPPSVDQPKLSDAQLSVAGSASTSITDGANFMLCDTSCIEGLFASAGFQDGTISFRAGGESVVVRKGQKKALIPIEKNASAITASAVAADGSTTATLSMKLDRADAAMEKAMKDKVATGSFQNASGSTSSSSGSTSSSSGSSKSIYMYVLIALLIVVAIGYNQRRKKATPAN